MNPLAFAFGIFTGWLSFTKSGREAGNKMAAYVLEQFKGVKHGRDEDKTPLPQAEKRD